MRREETHSAGVIRTGTSYVPARAASGRDVVRITLLILFLIGIAPRSTSANENVTLHLQWYHQFQFAGYYAAQEKGYFLDEGLDVRIVEGGPGTENFKAVLSAPGNYGTAHAAGLLLHRANGEPLVVLASIFQHSPNAIIARADRGIRNPHDLVPGQTVIWPGGHVELSAMLMSEGINPAPFLHKVNGDHLQELLDGKIDAIDGYVTNEALTLRNAGVPIVIISPVTYGVDFYGDVLMTSERELWEHPDRAKAFRTASLRGWEYAVEHPEEIVELIVSEYAPQVSREHLLSEAEATKSLVLNPLIEIGHTNPGRWQRMADTLVGLDMASPGIQAEDFLFDPNPATDLTKLYIGLGIAAATAVFIGLFAFVLLRFNRHLRREIFERKSNEEALRESEEYFRLFSLSSGDCFWNWDMVAGTVERSIGFELSFGYLKEEILSGIEWWEERIHPEDRERVLHVFETAVAGTQTICDYQYRFRRRDGSYAAIEDHVCLIRDAAGSVVRSLGAMHDITDGKRAEEALRDSEERNRLILDAVSGGGWDWDIKTGEVLFSDMWLQSLGYTREEATPHISFWESLIHPDDMPRVHEALKTHFEGHTEYFECENRLRVKSGEYRPNLDQGKVVAWDDDGKPVRMVGTDTDITERKQAEEDRAHLERQMQQTQKLESLGVMAGGIAHDFNNLLHIIAGNVNYALSEMPTESTTRENLHEIKTATRRAAELTDQMLAYAGKGTLVVEKLDLSVLVQEMAHLLEVSHSKKAIVKYCFDEHLPAVEGDPSQLRQVVMNLITNASEAIGDEDGSIIIETGVTEATQEYLATTYSHDELRSGSYVYLQVTDTGCGMSEDAQRRIFEPFFTTKFTGRGLGMAAVLGIVQGHKGAIDVDSEPGRGTTIKVMLPALDEPATPLPEEMPGNGDWRAHGTVLVVDDEAQIRTLMKLVLQSKGFTVLTAEDGQEATDIFRKHQGEIACVLLDLTMPHMGGEETFVELRKIEQDVPVVLVSGYSEKQLEERTENLDFAGTLKKPVDSDHLLDVVRSVLNG